ncbi:MAG: V-type ATP synthase subunit E family protein [Candidatus Omnitrophota bacterium]|nr:V-type ATP synthase subunit E family protein [Candidatus Omnitrophota bacterium]
MSENLKGLLEKINQEGIKSAEEKARVIEDKAGKNAEKILGDARKLADEIIRKAKAEAEKTKASADLSVKQASRDLLLGLKEDIRKTLNKIIAGEINQALSNEEIAGILADLIDKYAEKNGKADDIKILVKKEDLEKIKNTFVSKLKDKVKAGVEFRPSQNINAGFSISFDKGKSYFDFSDEGLLEALSAYLNPELAKLIA